MLNQTAIYAVRAMAYLASQPAGRPVMSAVIAEEMGIPKNFLSKILNRLAQAGFVETLRGRNGGISLSRKADQILLREVIELFMKIDDFKACFLGIKACDGSCGLHSRWQKISGQFVNMIDTVTVSRILTGR